MILGEIRAFIGDVPGGWLPCEGQKLSVDDYPGLYSSLGTIYGGDGIESFGLPDLRGRTLAGISELLKLGMSGGAAAVALTNDQMPNHAHPVHASSGVGGQASPVDGVWAMSSAVNGYAYGSNGQEMAADAISTAGEGHDHNNMQPYMALQWAITVGWTG